jgi:Lar family restriction alleviation protein
MGPYCNFCGSRCFCHFPQETPQRILDAYGTSSIIATCRAGQQFEKNKVGYCYDDILKEIELLNTAAKEGNLHLELEPTDLVSPCPFCGSKDIELQNTWTASYWIMCQSCGARVSDPGMERNPELYADHQASKAAALTAWNTRIVRQAAEWKLQEDGEA